ncbi:MAG: tetratricopeptide repeat protein [Promethearchaeota archaeon]
MTESPPPESDTQENSNLYEQVQLNIFDLLAGKTPLTFLVGAGISIESPSGLASARDFIDAIIRFAAPEDAIGDLLSIESMRYEYVMELFRDNYDEDLKFMQYFSLATKPNLLHRYLAEMVKNAHIVLTTNFDYLIEHAIGVDNKNLRIAITEKDFTAYNNPEQSYQQGLLVLYKIHGSLKNIITGEETKDSVITTLDALGKSKGDEIFSIGESKQKCLESACKGRILVIMGYSGGDDFDIVPALQGIKDIQKVVWIAHSPKVKSLDNVKAFRVRKDITMKPELIRSLTGVDELMYKMSILGDVDLIKINIHTSQLISRVLNSLNVSVNDIDESHIHHNFSNWLHNNFTPQDNLRNHFAAVIFRNYGKNQKALDYYQKSYALHKKLNDSHGIAAELGNMGIVYMHTGNYKQALECFQKAYEIDEKEENFKAMASNLGNMGIIYMDTGQPKRALKSHQLSYQINEKLGNLIGMGREQGNLGITYMQLGEPQKALEHFQNAFAFYERIGDLKGMGLELGNIGIIYMQSGQFNDALDYFQKSYTLLEKLGDIYGMAAQLGNLGITNRRLGQFDKALEYYQKSHTLYERLGDLQGLAAGLGNVGLIYVQIGELEKAMTNFQKSYALYKDLRNVQYMATQMTNIATVFTHKGQFNEALKHTQQAYALHEKLGNIFGMAVDMRNIGIIYAQLEQYDNALNHLKGSYVLFSKMNYLKDMALILSRISLIHRVKGQPKEAIDFSKKSYDLYAQLKNYSGCANELNTIGTIYYEMGLLEEALINLENAYKFYELLNQPKEMAEIQKYIDKAKENINKDQ